MGKKAQVKKVYHYAKSDSGKKAAAGVVVAGLAIYALSKAGITDKIGGGISDAISEFFDGISDMVTGGIKGVGWGAASVGSAPVKAVADLIYGEGKGAAMWNEGESTIKKEGLQVIFWDRRKIQESVQPRAHYSPLLKTFGKQYGITQGMSYIKPDQEMNFLHYNQVLASVNNPSEANYLYALQHGYDTSNWNPTAISQMSESFKRSVGLL